MQEEKRVRDLEDMLKRQDVMLLEEQQKVADMQAGLEEITRLTDAIMLRIVQEFGTDAPLGKLLLLQNFSVDKILEETELHVTRQGEDLLLTTVDRAKADEIETAMT